MDSFEGPAALTVNILSLVMWVVYVAALWKVFAKAGKPGWGAIVPFYNGYLLLKIAGKPGWWLILYLVPLVNIYVMFSTAIGIAKAFSRSTLFGVVMLGLLAPIGFMILGFGKSTYGGVSNSLAPTTQEPLDTSPKPPLITPEDQAKKV